MTYKARFLVEITPISPGDPVRTTLLGEVEFSGEREELLYDLPEGLRVIADDIEGQTKGLNEDLEVHGVALWEDEGGAPSGTDEG